jgi:hypothetical protein
MIMKKFVVAAATAVLLAGTALSTAQTQDTQGTGAQEEIIKKPNAGSGTKAAPSEQKPSAQGETSGKAKTEGQAQTEGQSGSANGTAQGDVKPDGSASAGAEGQAQTGGTEADQMKKKQNQASGEQKKEQNSGQAGAETEAAPGEQKQDQAGSETEKAPGQQEQQTGQGEQQQVPGQEEQQTGESEQQPSNETTGSININTEQKTEITQVFREVKSEPVDVDFEVNVGVVVPRTVTLRPLPPRVIEIVPAYRSYEYFVLADGRIIIVEPGTLKVVYVLVV